MAQYRAIADIALASGIYVFAGSTLADDGSPGTIPIPVGYPPPVNAVDPIDASTLPSTPSSFVASITSSIQYETI
jgi:hypothetical protein